MHDLRWGSSNPKSVQISCNTSATEIPPDQDFLSAKGVHLSSPLGGREGGEGKTFRKPKRIPASRKLTLKDDSTFKNSKNPDRISNSDRINSFLIRTALDYMNRKFHYEEKLWIPEDVESHVFTIICDKLKPESDYDAYMGGEKHGWTYAKCARFAHRAAMYACQMWEPDHFEKQARRGAKGGAVSKRKPTYTRADARRVDGLTHEEAAEVLKVSVSTVRRMRKDYPAPKVPAPMVTPEHGKRLLDI